MKGEGQSPAKTMVTTSTDSGYCIVRMLTGGIAQNGFGNPVIKKARQVTGFVWPTLVIEGAIRCSAKTQHTC